MKKILYYTTCVIILLAITSCTKKAPGCADEEIVDLVIKIATEKFFVMVREHKGIDVSDRKDMKLGIENIRTNSVNKKTGARSCAANLTLEISGQKENKNVPITYTSEPVEGKSGNVKSGKFYVNVSGL